MSSFSMENETAKPTSIPAEKSLPEEVVDIRTDENGNKFYLIKWYGFSPEKFTWESENTLHEMAICSSYLLYEFKKKLQSRIEKAPVVVEPLPLSQEMAIFANSESPTNGCELVSSPDEVIGVIDKEGDHDFLIKWEGVENIQIIPREVAKQIWPEVVIKYYEENLVWQVLIFSEDFSLFIFTWKSSFFIYHFSKHLSHMRASIRAQIKEGPELSPVEH